jgi:nicotinamidase-related amidase
MKFGVRSQEFGVKKYYNKSRERFFEVDRGNDGKKTGLNRILKKEKIRRLVVYGIATDYCVRATALDAVALGYQVTLIKNLCRGVAPDTTQKALEEMKSKGVIILDDADLSKFKSN